MVVIDERTEIIGRRYQLRQPLGTGGMGAVFAATDRLTGATVALKRVATTRGEMDGEALRLALTREFHTLASLRHPNVIGVLDYGFDSQREPYFTMPLVENAASLREVGYNKPLLQKVDFIIQILQALVYLHRRGIIHRDLKPDNIVVSPDGQVRLLDFGLALARGKADVVKYAGTLRYMAPEVLQGASPNEASDLYSVGIIAYELLAGRYAFTGETPQELIANILSIEPDLTGIDILTSGELRHAARQLATDTERTTDPAIDQTILFADTTPQDDVPTQVFDPAQAAGQRVTSGRDYAAASPFVRIIARLIAKQPERRYQSAAAVIDDLWAALGRSDTRDSADIRDSFLQAARFVGRDAELAQLESALRGAANGGGAVWLVGGESGVGKSRLLDELRTLAMVQGAAVLRGQAVGDGGTPYDMWREPLRHMVLAVEPDEADAAVLQQIVPDLGRLLGREIAVAPELNAGDAHERLLAAIRRLIDAYCRANRQGVLLILEDVHWAAHDLSALSVLPVLARQLPLLVVCSYSDDETPDLPQRLGGCELMRLGRLNADSIVELSESMLGPVGREPKVVALLQRETEGNAYFLIEAARALAEEVGVVAQADDVALPSDLFVGGIEAVLQRRLDHVPPEYQPLLLMAAIHGREVDMAVLKQIAGDLQVDDWLTACVNAAVMDWQDGRWRFAHEKLRHRLLDKLPMQTRPPMYRVVARAVETVYSQSLDKRAGLLAHLWAEAGDTAAEYHYSLMAGEAATELAAYADAARAYQRALDILLAGDDRPAERQEIALRLKLGNLAQALGQYTQAADTLMTAYRLAKTSDSPRQAAEALLGLGRVCMRQGNRSRALEHATDALAIVETTEDVWLQVEALHLNAVIDLAEGRYEQAQGLLRACLPLLRRLNDPAQEVSVLTALGTAREGLGQYDDAVRTLNHALWRAERLRNRALTATVRASLGRLNYYHGHYDDARRQFDDALPLFQAVGNVYGEASVLFYLGSLAIHGGQYREALRLLHQSADLSRQIGAASLTLVALCGFARLAAVRDRDITAAELLGFVLNQVAYTGEIDIEREAVPLLNRLGDRLPMSVLDEALERGKNRTLDDIVEEIELVTKALNLSYRP